MKSTCEKLQEILATDGPQALRQDDGAQKHLEECEECFSFLEALNELDASLKKMPTTDAPDSLVEGVLARPEIKKPVELTFGILHERGSRKIRIPWFGWAALGSATAFVLLVITLVMPSLNRARSVPTLERADIQYEHVREQQEVDRLESREAGRPDVARSSPVSPPPPPPPALKFEFAPAEPEPPRDETAELKLGFADDKEQSAGLESGKKDAGNLPGGVSGDVVGGLAETPKTPSPLPRGNELAGERRRAQALTMIKHVPPVYPEAAKAKGIEGTVKLRIQIDGKGNVTRAEVVRSIPLLDQAAIDAVLQWEYEPRIVDGAPVPFTTLVDVKFQLEDPGTGSREALTFKPARGYWANTYLPGDPEMRFLQARLQQFKNTQLQPLVGKNLRLHEAVHPPYQPFDSPANASMAVYLHADRKAISGETRLLLQLGLKGIDRQAGRRPAMNVGVVLDLRGEVPLHAGKAVRALLTALNLAKEPGDRFRLVVAGRPGGLVLGPEAFRHGTLTAALDRLFAPEPPVGDARLNLVEATKTAIEDVGNDDDPAAVLGSSLVLLITGQPLGEATKQLAALAHQSAVAGIPLSVVGVGSNTLPNEINQIALAGQGNRRLLEQPSEAARIIDLELSAASRVVARAVRVNIRLAKGVRLVDILRSRPLDERQTQQVREAEQSIDLRMALNLGIEADRGDDDDGVQIIIPNFYASDEHAILLDVVASGPGPLAEVTVRYKDLAFLRNATARAGLSLPRGAEAAGPLELNVVKNLLSTRFAEALENAGNALSRDQAGEAANVLTRYKDELTRRWAESPSLRDDDTMNDLEILEDYLRLLNTSAVQNASLRNYLADSLRYAGWLKIQPPLLAS